MQNSSLSETRRGLLLTLFLLGLVTALILVPSQFHPEAGAKKGEGLFTRTSSQEDNLVKMWDIREEGKSDLTQVDILQKYRESVGKDASAVADVRDQFARGEAELRARIPYARVEYNNDIRIPEVIAPDVNQAKIQMLTPPSDAKRADLLKTFAKENDSLIGVTPSQVDSLKTLADYMNPSGNMGFAHLIQEINGVSVFRGEIKAGFTPDGRLIRVINNLAPGLNYESLSKDFGDPVRAIQVAGNHVQREIGLADVTKNEAESRGNMLVFGTGDSATTAEKMYFPTEPGVAVPAWRILLYKKVAAYYVIVDAINGVVLWHKNIVDDQTQSATYQVYANPNATFNIADSPAPLSPGPNDPTLGTQGALITRSNVTRIGNEAPYTFNNNGWINDGQNITDGNANEAGLDVVTPDGVDAPETGSPNRVFDSTWNPPPGNPAPGDAPTVAAARRGAVIQMFYAMNLYHDELYRLGFTELALNFQHDNFGRGGLGNDRVRSEGQDSSGTNNANFLTPADGGRGRMQMYVWTGPTPDYDGTGDAEVIFHEVTHGTSNRLHGNGSGLGNQGGMMGEGWGDWYGISLLSEPTDPINGIHTTGGYATYLIAAGFTSNYYHGIRRFPKAMIGVTGGPPRPGCNNQPCPHNPLSFRHINTGCDTEIGNTTTANISAFPRGPVGTTGACSQVHNAGEIWSSALWEVRGILITRLGWAVGNRKAMQLVLDGMKLSPLNPTMIQERNAIITAAAAAPASPETSADVVDVREGFRRRGMGFSASVQSASAVTEAFDFPNIAVVNPFSVSDAPGDGDGFPEPGENVILNVSINNNTGGAITGVQVNVNGGPNVSVGTVNDGQTVQAQIPYTVPGGAVCGSLHQVTINASSSVGAQQPVIREFRLGAPVGGAPVTFTSNTAVTINDNAPAAPYSTSIVTSGLSGNKVMRLSLNNVTHTFPSDIDFLLEGPAGQKFLGVSDSGGGGDVSGLTISFSDTAAALPSTSQWAAGTFLPHNVDTTTDAFVAPAPASPYLNAQPAGTATFATAFGTAGANLNGTWNLWIRDDAGQDTGTMGGWSLTFEANDYACTVDAVRSRADFDGDGKTDLSVFRPSEGNWYLNRSTAGFQVLNWGVSTDTLVPGDYDGDGKTDTAIYRPNADPNMPDFYILNSNGLTVSGVSWGTTGDVPVIADYNADAKSDVAVFRPSNNTWYVLNSGGAPSITAFGQAGDVPVAGNFAGSANADLTLYRSSTNSWVTQVNGGGVLNFVHGTAGDILVPADYDGDNTDDRAVYRPSSGQWFVLKSSDGTVSISAWGNSTDVPVPGDYDGDGKDDVAIYRNGQWWVNRSTAGTLIANFGVSTDKAIPRQYVP